MYSKSRYHNLLSDYIHTSFGIKIPESCDEVDGTINNEEATFLRELCTKARSLKGPVVEIGALFGFSANIIGHAYPEGSMVLVENFSWNPYELSHAEHRQCLDYMIGQMLPRKKVEVVSSLNDLPFDNFPPPSVVFIDSSHCYEGTIKEISWAKKNKANIVCGHDYSSMFPGVVRAVNESGGCRELVGSLWSLNLSDQEVTFVEPLI